MGGGGPGKIGQEKDKSTYDLVMEILTGTKGIQETVGAQAEEGFKTGDIKALHEQIKQALEVSMGQASEDRTAATTALAQKNLTRTPVGQAALSKINLEGKQRTATIPTDMVNEVLMRLAPLLTGQSVETAISGNNSLADISARNSINSRLGNANSLSTLIQGVGQLGAAGIQGYYGGTTTPPPTLPPPTGYSVTGYQPGAIGVGIHP